MKKIQKSKIIPTGARKKRKKYIKVRRKKHESRNETKTKKITQKINEMKNQLFKNMDKIGKPLVKLQRDKKQIRTEKSCKEHKIL